MRRRNVILGVVAVALAAASTASAAVTVKGVDASGYPTVRLSVVSSEPFLKPPTLTEDGRHVVGLRAQNLGRQKFVVVAIDRSNSMEAPKFA